VNRTLIMVAKEPVPGSCKTRLCPPLSAGDATDLYHGFVTDLVGKLRDLSAQNLTTGIAYTPDAAVTYFEREAPGLLLLPQEGPSLGERLCGIAKEFLKQACDSVVIMSSDSPTIPTHLLLSAFDRLRESDVVVGPCFDGGYYLIGLSTYAPKIFERITWSTDQVLLQTVDRAREAGLSVSLLPTWYDVDTVADLTQLAADALGSVSETPATAAVLRRLMAEGRIPAQVVS
jgi:rSAM/selenodomain-associated transferase 1